MIRGLELLLSSDLWDDKKNMAVKDRSAIRPFQLKSDLRLVMAAKYWYMIQIGVLNNDLRFVVLC